LIVNNIVKACTDIEYLNTTGYKFIYLASGFIAHYNLNGFKAYYSDHSLKRDIELNAKSNMWNNFIPSDRNYDYYMSKKDIYQRILGQLVAKDELDAIQFMRDHFQIIHIGG
jgi:hypothetical protein